MQLPILTNKDTYLHDDLFQLCSHEPAVLQCFCHQCIRALILCSGSYRGLCEH